MLVHKMVQIYLERMNEHCKKMNLDYIDFLQRLCQTMQEYENKGLSIDWEDILNTLPAEVMKELKVREGDPLSVNYSNEDEAAEGEEVIML